MKKHILSLFFIILLMAFASCDKTNLDGDIVVLLGKENYVKNIDTMIPDSLSTEFLSRMGNVAEGYIPPNIEGEYIIGPIQFCYSNAYSIFDKQDVNLKITNQHNRVATVELYDEGYQITDTAYIMGEGQCFTLYFTEDRELSYFGSISSITRNVVITGEKTETGIRNLYFGNIIQNVYSGGSPYIGSFVPGWYFIYKDQDGMSEESL